MLAPSPLIIQANIMHNAVKPALRIMFAIEAWFKTIDIKNYQQRIKINCSLRSRQSNSFPSYGSVQGAQDTLDKKSGNAIDTASLLIALLRSAGVNARYVYGVVDIPANKVMNWVGGAQNADAAQQILGQGGIPNMALTSGGQTKTFRLEHVWVEAFVQYAPAGGAKHIGGQTQGDTWIPMDASFKQYKFTEGMDLNTAVPFDAQAFADAAQQGATVNEAEGWVQHLNQGALQAQLNSYQARLKTHIEAQNNGQSTVGEVLGVMQAKIDTLPILDSMLPYVVKNTSASFSEIPNQLRHQFRYQIYADDYSRRIEASPLLEFQAPTVSLAGKKVTLSWVAANEANQQAIEALIPTPAAGQQIKPEDLPQGLGAGIMLKPQLRVEGELKAEGQGMRAGSEPIGAGAFTTYANIAEWDETTDQLITGQQSALGLSIQGISQKQLETLKTRMEATKAKLEQAQQYYSAGKDNLAQQTLQGINGDHLTGDMLSATVQSYFASVHSQAKLVHKQAQMIDLPALSYGLFHASAQPNKLYGIVTTGVRFKGVNIDIGHMRYIRWSTQNDKAAWISYNKMRGQYASAMEHAVPEQFWVDKTQCRYTDDKAQLQNPNLADCAQGISAVKAIAIAAAQGQKIYTINPANAATALPQLSVGGSVGTEIRNAIAAGKEVSFHENAISAHGWTGYGYSIIDPETGVGAYIIEGKGNGGYLTGTAIGLSVGAILAAAIEKPAAISKVSPLLIEALEVVLLSVTILISVYSIFDSLQGNDQISVKCFLSGLMLGLMTSLGWSITSFCVSKTCGNIVGTLLGLAGFYLSEKFTPMSAKDCHVYG